MQVLKDQAIVLKRVDYGEADRIVTVLTKTNGRIELMAKGCRKQGSKLAGGIEPLTVNDIAWIPSKKESSLSLLRSARSSSVYSSILNDYDTLKFAYDLLEIAEKVTRHNSELGLFEVLETMFGEVDGGQNAEAIQVWYLLQVLRINGQQPDLSSDSEDKPLEEGRKYLFDTEAGSLRPSESGRITANHIKALRVLQQMSPSKAVSVGGLVQLLPDLIGPVRSIYDYHL